MNNEFNSVLGGPKDSVGGGHFLAFGWPRPIPARFALRMQQNEFLYRGANPNRLQSVDQSMLARSDNVKILRQSEVGRIGSFRRMPEQCETGKPGFPTESSCVGERRGRGRYVAGSFPGGSLDVSHSSYMGRKHSPSGCPSKPSLFTIKPAG